jgi:hypothetical protein
MDAKPVQGVQGVGARTAHNRTPYTAQYLVAPCNDCAAIPNGASTALVVGGETAHLKTAHVRAWCAAAERLPAYIG